MMDVYLSEKVTTVRQAPVGLLLLEKNGNLIVKSEYRLHGKCECIIVSSGEHYCGEGDDALCKSVIVA